MEYFDFLPQDITLDILSRLPIESVLECKLVCTSWRNIVSHHPSFSKLNFHRLNQSFDSGELGFVALTRPEKFYYVEYNENHDESTNPIQRIRRINLTSPIRDAVFVGSYNGLICLARGPSVCVCNPITRELVMLPEIKRDCYDTQCNCHWMHGFGYVSSTNEYKVVGMCTLDSFYFHVQVQIYTLGSGSGWRNLGNFNFESSGSGTFVNEALYWLDDKLIKIETFDLAEEKFSENLLLPDYDSEFYHCCIGVLDGFLYFANNLDAGGYGFYDIWLLKTKNNNHEMEEGEEHQSLGWSQEFWADSDISLALTKNHGLLTYNFYYLNICDTETSISKGLVKFKNDLQKVFPHKNTLVSLKELGEENAITMETVKIEETRSSEQLQDDANPDYIYL